MKPGSGGTGRSTYYEEYARPQWRQVRPEEKAACVPPTTSIVPDLCPHILVGIHLSVVALRAHRGSLPRQATHMSSALSATPSPTRNASSTHNRGCVKWMSPNLVVWVSLDPGHMMGA